MYCYDTVERTLRAFHAPGSVFEIRILVDKTRANGGYFNDPATAATAVGDYLEQYPSHNVFFTPNPVQPALLSRAYNRIKYGFVMTGSADILRRNWLLVDIDPVRPAGIASTAEEYKTALLLGKQINDDLLDFYGFHPGIIASSGNGCHLCYALPDIPDDDNTLVRNVLKGLAASYDKDTVKVDTVCHNPDRIWRLYGTPNRKGDHTEERPHRLSKLYRVTEFPEKVPLSSLRAIEKLYKIKENRTAPTAKKASSYPLDEGLYRNLNAYALTDVSRWVPHFFPEAKSSDNGKKYRITSLALGRPLEEDVQIQNAPYGIKDFGEHDVVGEKTEGRRTPVSLLSDLLYQGNKEKAANKLAECLGVKPTEFDAVTAELGIETKKVIFDYRQIKSVEHLQTRHFRPLKWIVHSLIPSGCFFLVSRPKMRKSFMMLQLALAVSTGKDFLGYKTEKSEVLLLALEDNERRIQTRTNLILSSVVQPDLSGFFYFSMGGFPRGEHGVEVLREYVEKNPNTKLIIIDTFAHFRGANNTRDLYQKDYDSVMPITRFANDHDICVIIVHHERKGAERDKSDYLEDVSGTSGLTGAVDGVFSIKGQRGRRADGAAESYRLMVTGRDIPEEHDIELSFDTHLGGWYPAKKVDDTVSIMRILRDNGNMLKLTEIHFSVSHLKRDEVQKRLLTLRQKGYVVSTAGGYMLTEQGIAQLNNLE